MKQIGFSVVLIATLVLLCACPNEERHRYITFVNESGKKIVSQSVSSGAITSADTLYFCGMRAVGIKANSQYIFDCPLRDNGWENSFDVIPFLQFTIMDAETYDIYMSEPCDTIRKYVPVLHTYQLTLEDLQRLDWTVTYPPTNE